MYYINKRTILIDIGVQSEAILNTFFLLMTHHPEIVKRAQAELDEVTKETQRLPTFTDKHKLQYIDCIVNELYR